MQFFGIEETIKPLTKASPTTVNWEAGSNLRVGGQAYNVTSVLTLDTATDIDTGSIANNSFYYIYAVVVAGVVSLKYSLSSSAPTGFAAYRKIGALTTDGSAEVLDAKKGQAFMKCQKKTAGANITVTGVVSNLTFNNLTIGKMYDVKHNLFVDSQTSTTTDKDLRVEALNGAQSIFIGRLKNSSGANIEGHISNAEKFIAKATTMTLNISTVTNTRLNNRSEVELCQLSKDGYDAVIETNEW